MNKQFYNKVVSDLKALEARSIDNNPVTLEELNKFKKEAIEMLQIVNGTKEYEAVKMSTEKGKRTTKHEVLLSAIIDRINNLKSI